MSAPKAPRTQIATRVPLSWPRRLQKIARKRDTTVSQMMRAKMQQIFDEDAGKVTP